MASITGGRMETEDDFVKEEMDVSIHPFCWLLSCPFAHCGFCPYQTILTLEAEELVRKDKAICGERMTQRSYKDLGTVEQSFFCCLVCVDTELGTIISGWGCEAKKSEILVEKLRKLVKEHPRDQKLSQLVNSMQLKTTEVVEKLELIEKFIRASPMPNAMNDR